MWTQLVEDFVEAVVYEADVAPLMGAAFWLPKGTMLFQTLSVRKLALPLAIPVCVQELPEGKARGVNCANCGVCWR